MEQYNGMSSPAQPCELRLGKWSSATQCIGAHIGGSDEITLESVTGDRGTSNLPLFEVGGYSALYGTTFVKYNIYSVGLRIGHPVIVAGDITGLWSK